jgi:site-specific DNA-cytosine methylase
MNYLDGFSGIGGFALGAYWAGIKFEKHYFSEIDRDAATIYQKRFPDAIPLGDIRKIHSMGVDREVQYGDEQYIPPGYWIISGGFPCQDISVAGKGAGLDGSRSGLWYEYARLIGEIRPHFAIMENVGALTIRGLDRVLGSLAEAGYDAEWCDIRASDVGAPHRRERIWIVAWPSDWNANGKHEQTKPGLCGREESNAGGIRRDVAYAQSGESGEPAQRERGQDSCGGSKKECFSNPRCAGVYKRWVPENVGGNGRQPGGIFRNGLPGRKEENEVFPDTDSTGFQAPGAEQQTAGYDGCREIPYAGDIWTLEWQRKLRSNKQVVPGGEDNGRGAGIDEVREWWETEPPVCCLVDGLPAGMDGYEGRICNNAYRRAPQLKGLGNAIVPHIAMMIWLMIKRFL